MITPGLVMSNWEIKVLTEMRKGQKVSSLGNKTCSVLDVLVFRYASGDGK